MKVELAVLGSPSLTSLMISVAVKNHERRTMSHCDFVPHRNETLKWLSSQPLLMRDCHSGGDRVKSKNFNHPSQGNST